MYAKAARASVRHQTKSSSPISSSSSARYVTTSRADLQQRFRRRRPACRPAASTNDEARSSSGGGSSGSSSALPDVAPFVSLGGDTYILRSFARSADAAAPRFDLDLDGALRVQLDALRRNNRPYPDHGVEVMYRFAAFDPFERSRYFGRSFDLGQFERFRRVFHTPAYKPLLGHDSAEVVGRLELGRGAGAGQRVAVRVVVTSCAGTPTPEEAAYTVTMLQRQGGPYDGYWVTESVLADAADWDTVITSW